MYDFEVHSSSSHISVQITRISTRIPFWLSPIEHMKKKTAQKQGFQQYAFPQLHNLLLSHRAHLHPHPHLRATRPARPELFYRLLSHQLLQHPQCQQPALILQASDFTCVCYSQSTFRPGIWSSAIEDCYQYMEDSISTLSTSDAYPDYFANNGGTSWPGEVE